jgi:hypothetical protein
LVGGPGLVFGAQKSLLDSMPKIRNLGDCYWDGTVDPKRIGCTVTTIGGTFSAKYEVGVGGAYGTLTEMAVALSAFLDTTRSAQHRRGYAPPPLAKETFA